MILWHGTNMEFSEIDLAQSKLYKDFGRGFYLTDIRQQAEEMARRKAVFYGGEAVVQAYEFDESVLNSGRLKVKVFAAPTEEWASFILSIRSRSASPYVHDYDIVIGPVADDGVAYLLGRYEEGSYTLSQLAAELKYKQLNSQYFFGTQRAVDCLRRV